MRKIPQGVDLVSFLYREDFWKLMGRIWWENTEFTREMALKSRRKDYLSVSRLASYRLSIGYLSTSYRLSIGADGEYCTFLIYLDMIHRIKPSAGLGLSQAY
jgi:hypothetical protein